MTRWLIYLSGALSVVVIVLGFCMALQGRTIDSLEGKVATQAIELTEASRALKQALDSGKSSVGAVEVACTTKEALEDKQKVVKKRIREVFNVKANGGDVSSELSDSMWVAYCDGEGASVHCTTK